VPPDPVVISEALSTLLTDDAARDALLAAGQRRLRRFSWSDSATVVLQALEQAATGS
jgi:glycosyltransferase involved in cell wall biosynthesis